MNNDVLEYCLETMAHCIILCRKENGKHLYMFYANTRINKKEN